tara:strand:- start:1088 stop:1228 length:141 start_codon:yes stop_codon:yes gene_type:complete
MYKESYNLTPQVYKMLCDDYDSLLDKLEELNYDDYYLQILRTAKDD